MCISRYWLWFFFSGPRLLKDGIPSRELNVRETLPDSHSKTTPLSKAKVFVVVFSFVLFSFCRPSDIRDYVSQMIGIPR